MSDFFFSHPNNLWALTILAVVVALYLFYRRYRPLPITGLFLWGEPKREGQGGRTVEKPLFSRSFWFDMLAAALLALALAGPSWRSDSGRPVAVVMDDSFAMLARGGYGRAVELAAALFERAERNGVPSILVLAGARPTVLSGTDAGAGEKRDALVRHAPADAPGSLYEAVSLVRDLYGDGMDVHVLTNRDQDVAPGGVPHTVHFLKGRGGNLALGKLWRRSAGPDERLIVEATNFSTAAAVADLVVRVHGGAGEELARSDGIPMAPGATATFEYALSGVRDKTVSVELLARAGEDVIAEDSVAFLPASVPETMTYGLDGVGDGAPYFRLALEAAGCAPVAGEKVAPDILITRDAEAAGIVLTLQLTAAGEPGVYMPPYVVDLVNPLCRDVDLAAVPWVVATREPPEEAGQAYILAGDMPLYWRSRAERLHLNLVPERCLIVREPAWPALVANLVAEARALRPGLGKTAYRPGEALRFRGGTRALEVVADASGRALPLRSLMMPKQAGLYTLRQGGNALADVSVLPLHGAGSDTTALSGRDRLVRAGGGGEREEGVLDLTWLFLGLGLAFVSVNWRRREVRP